QPARSSRVVLVQEEATVAAFNLTRRPPRELLERRVRPHDGVTGSPNIGDRDGAFRSAQQSFDQNERLVPESLACCHWAPPLRGLQVLSRNKDLPCLPRKAIIHAACPVVPARTANRNPDGLLPVPRSFRG